MELVLATLLTIQAVLNRYLEAQKIEKSRFSQGSFCKTGFFQFWFVTPDFLAMELYFVQMYNRFINYH